MTAVPHLDNEFMEYWLKLSAVQKESLLSVARNFVELKEETDINERRKNIILEEREKYFRGEGNSLTPEQVRQMAMRKDKRNAGL
ncbi:MAG TPA: hypothetical protein VG890_02225 [Puia sp.]|nr:hypothetical protein [Puia sp.]